jgi:23S rRNA (adenine2503-C2)-methyltransferase
MPINKKWPVAELFEALDYWNARSKNQKLTLEYILIQDVNDSLEQAAILARHARRLHAKVNLIPYNTVEGLEWKRPPTPTAAPSSSILKNAGVTATLRLEKGHDIDAACGQLRLKQETARASSPWKHGKYPLGGVPRL